MKKCRIVLADDHALVRQGIKKTLEDEEYLEVVGEVADGLELFDLIRTVVPDIIVLDISMPHLCGIEAIGDIREICPQVKVLILTMHKSEQYLCSAMYAGANGYLLKEDSDTELVIAITRILRGEIYVSPALSEECSENILLCCAEGRKAGFEKMTSREKEILRYVAEGRTSRDIAESLSISRRTVEHHRASLLKKLGIKNTAELVKYAISKGIVPPP